ncbi:DHA2 family efflux MFS transporter permease subunit [Amycolatopsis rhizosphaerae]|uniref:DHA2 family efflux MFS transporter permease subunit n=1 Tax=Amycolatopsis rhizosphaerae TaxID=2053003 RepID=A0A558B8B3_9PSEU|nr:DHA2 family efflux MFS transporter permease subunit [Amycolatopsis rhizosphaerae]TVT32737.1 DHA2 family efflux MFS transporter permease subunit [Amycolatopsis rhizosphaerae]
MIDRIPWPVWRVALVVVFGGFVSMLDTSLVNVGLDSIAADLGASLASAQWIASGYLIALAVSLPLCGWLGRKVGVGRLWLWSFGAFTVASGLCALAGDLGWLVALRVLQGVSAGLLVPAGQTVLGQAVGPQRLGRVMSILGIAVSTGPAIGPTLGGLLLNSLSWPWLFLINLPIGVAGIGLGLKYVPRGERGAAPRLDWSGLILISVGLPMFVYAVSRWSERATLADTSVLVPLVLGFAGLLAFAARSWRRANALVDLRLFRDPVFAAATVVTAFAGATLFGAMLLFPLYFQVLRGADVITTGLSLFSLGLGTAIVAPLGGRLTDRYGGGIVALWGNVLTLVTTAPFAFLGAHTDAVTVQALLFLRGMAIALATMPAGAAAYAAVRRDQLPDATTTVNIMQRIGGALGGALFAVVLAAALPRGAESAFQQAFWWVSVASVGSVVCAAWLWLAQRSARAAQRTPAAMP